MYITYCHLLLISCLYSERVEPIVLIWRLHTTRAVENWNRVCRYFPGFCRTLSLFYLISWSILLSNGARCSSMVECPLMVQWVVGSILHGVDPLSYFSFQPVLHDWCNKGRGMCYPVCEMVHIKEPLLLIDKSSLCGSSWFPLSLSEWSLTICLTPYNRK